MGETSLGWEVELALGSGVISLVDSPQIIVMNFFFFTSVVNCSNDSAWNASLNDCQLCNASYPACYNCDQQGCLACLPPYLLNITGSCFLNCTHCLDCMESTSGGLSTIFCNTCEPGLSGNSLSPKDCVMVCGDSIIATPT
jgi:cysteine-rich repeat protein